MSKKLLNTLCRGSDNKVVYFAGVPDWEKYG